MGSQRRGAKHLDSAKDGESSWFDRRSYRNRKDGYLEGAGGIVQRHGSSGISSGCKGRFGRDVLPWN